MNLSRQNPSSGWPSARKQIICLFAFLWLSGLTISYALDDYVTMQVYTLILAAASIYSVLRLARFSKNYLSCYSMMMLAPIWFAYLEAIFPNGDCWFLPSSNVIRTLSYIAFFLMMCNLFYFIKMPSSILRFHDKFFSVLPNKSLMPLLAVAVCLLTLYIILERYSWDIDLAIRSYTLGREGGSGLIKRGGLGGNEVFLQIFEYMLVSVPTIAALSWIKFGQEKLPNMVLRTMLTLFSIFIVFLMFLGGGRLLMAIYLAGPALVWLVRKRNKRVKFTYWIATFLMFISLLTVWEYQKNNRNNPLENISELGNLFKSTATNLTENHRDNNLYVFTLNEMYRPNPYEFEGFYDFYLNLINPIPRALWPGKPKGLQESPEMLNTPVGPEAEGPIYLGTSSLSRTIVGDGFRMSHYFGIILYSAVYSIAASFWDSIGPHRPYVSKLYFILHSAWLFWILWGFRGGFAFVSGAYPVLGAYLICICLSSLTPKKLQSKASADFPLTSR